MKITTKGVFQIAIYRDEQGNIISRKSPVYGSGKRTEAQKRANRKYYALHYKTIGGKIPLEHLPEIEQYALKNGLTISRLVVKSITYCMENRIELSNPKKDVNSSEKRNKNP